MPYVTEVVSDKAFAVTVLRSALTLVEPMSCRQVSVPIQSQVALYFDKHKGSECPKISLAKIWYACDEALYQLQTRERPLDPTFLADMNLPTRQFQFLLDEPAHAQRRR